MTDETTQVLDAPAKASELGRSIAIIQSAGRMMAVPENLQQQIEFAQLMSKGGPMIGKPFRNHPGACLGIAGQAWRWGMDPYSVSQKSYLVNDIIAYEAQLVHAVILKLAPLSKRPRFTYAGEGAERRCTVIFHIKGEVEPVEYTSPPVGKIQPKNSPLWKTDEDQQLSYYTIRAGARRYFPEILMGVYDDEEVRSFTVEAQAAITLGGDVDRAESGEDIPEADFTPIDAVLNKAKPAKEKGGASKDAAPAKSMGDGSPAKTKADKDKPKPAGAKAGSAAAPKPEEGGGQPAETPASTAAGSEQPEAGDQGKPATVPGPVDYAGLDDILARVEELTAAGSKLSARKYVDTNREELQAAVDRGPKKLAERAKKALDDYPPQAGK